jgi:hypothetical protein
MAFKIFGKKEFKKKEKRGQVDAPDLLHPAPAMWRPYVGNVAAVARLRPA